MDPGKVLSFLGSEANSAVQGVGSFVGAVASNVANAVTQPLNAAGQYGGDILSGSLSKLGSDIKSNFGGGVLNRPQLDPTKTFAQNMQDPKTGQAVQQQATNIALNAIAGSAGLRTEKVSPSEVPDKSLNFLNNEQPPAKPSEQISPEDMSKLSKTEDPTQAKKILQPVLGPVLADKVAAAVAHVDNKDPNIISNIVDSAVQQHLPTPEAPGQPIPPAMNQEQPAAQPPASGPPGAGGAPPLPPSPPSGEDVTPFMNEPGEQPKVTHLMNDMPERGFTTSVKESPVVSPETKALVDEKYSPQANKDLVLQTHTLLDQGLPKATDQVVEALNKPIGTINAQDVSDAMTVARAYDIKGENEKAQQIYDRLAQHGTATGQTIQAFSMLNSRTPDGLKYWVAKTLNKAGVDYTGPLKEKLDEAFSVLKQQPDDTPGHSFTVGKIQQLVEQELPSSATDKTFAVWRAGLLTGPQTVAKIVTSHAVNTALENVKDVPGASVDKFLSLFTGQRSLVASGKGLGEGFGKGIAAAKTNLTTGIDINPGSNAVELQKTVNFGKNVPGKILNAYVNGVGRIHGSLYKPFFGAAHLQSLYNQALAAAKTAGLKGEESDSFVTNFVHSPSPQALKVAQHDAEMATFQQTTKLGQVASAIQQKGFIIGKVIAPFTKIPSAIATDLMNYSPIGAMKSIVDGIKAARSEEGLTVEAQRQLSQGLGRGITGTAALIPGIMLYSQGLMTLGYPTDPKEQALWASEGKQPDSVLIGGQWRRLGAIGPLGSVLSIGGHISDSLIQGQDIGTASLNGLVGGLQSISGQSYLQGINSATDALKDPSRYAGNFVEQTAGSVIPTGVYTAAAATDPLQRQVTGDNLFESGLNAIKSRLPGVRETLNPKVNAFGDAEPAGSSGLERVIDPFQSTNAQTTPLLGELRRLENAGFGEMPTAVTKTENFGTSKQPMNATLTRDQMSQLTALIGKITESTWSSVVNNPQYQSMPDDQKQLYLKSLYASAAREGKTIFAEHYKLGPFSADVVKSILQSRQKRVQVV